LRALREGIDTGTPTGRAVAAIMATLAELELELGASAAPLSRDSRRARRLPATKTAKLGAQFDERLDCGDDVRKICCADLLLFGLRGTESASSSSRSATCRRS
jgi:DNA invertase Pin-like site-specific DNA recombinase